MSTTTETADPIDGRIPPQLSAGRQPCVLLIFNTQYEEAAAMLRGIAEYEREHGAWQVFFDDMAHSESDADWLLGHNWDGVISRHTSPMLAQACVERRIPLVDLNDSPAFAGVSKIRPSNSSIGRLGAEHLLSAGFRSFAFSGFRNEGWARERRVGFVEALARAGQLCVVHEVDYPGGLSPDWDRQQQTALADWLRQLPKQTAVMACNDMRALQVLAAANALSLRVPEELAVLGANNDAIRCELAQPSLSSVATNPAQAGRQAAELLAQFMAGQRSGGAVDLRIEPAGVVVRCSTDVLAVADKGVAAAIAYIRAHACEGINVDQVLRHVAVSRAQIERKFRKHLGRSPQAEIRRVQIQRISQLLAETDLPLKRIAEMSGFDYMEYMSTVFKRATGHTPGGYRRLHRPAGGQTTGTAA
jgi:LacI family transcriptional regulator